jgi:hypothetical protein
MAVVELLLVVVAVVGSQAWFISESRGTLR